MAQFPIIARLSASFLLLWSGLSSYGQPIPVAQAFDQYRQQTLTEKLFVHTDQNFYLTGETLWFSVYYVDGTFHKPLDLSKVVYIELLDAAGKPAVQTKVALTSGGGSGSLFLPASLRSGLYQMRAYTSYMKNAGAGYFFEKSLTIVNPFLPLDPPAPAPVADYDVQLFPEGGHLVQGLQSRVAFKVVDANGRGVFMRGWLLTGQNDTLARFNSHKFGMGSFDVTPAAGITHRVLMQDERGRLVTRSLPAVSPQGYVMRVTDGGNQLTVTVKTNVDAPLSVSLFAHTRNAIKLKESKSIEQETSFAVDKNVLGDGITHLTVFNARQQPVCERLYFKRPAVLPITLNTDQPTYAVRAPVTLDVSAQGLTKTAGQPTLSVAVYRLDSLSTASSENILSSLYLTSDLPGYVESPIYYLQPETTDRVRAIDNLMLTHGWRRFRWDDVLSGTTPPRPFIAEVNGPLVQGHITDPATGAFLPGKLTYLSAVGKPIRLYTSMSDSTGRVRFELRDFYGPKSLILQTNPQDSLANVDLLNPFSDEPPARPLPAFTLPETRSGQLLNRSVSMQVQSAYANDQTVRYPAIDSMAFYGKPSERYLLDTYTRFPRMEEVLREYVLGVMPRKRQGRFNLDVMNAPYRAIFESPALVLIDGVPVFDGDQVIDFSPLKVKQLDVLTNRYFMGPAQFSGIVSFMTYKGDLAEFSLGNHVLKLDYEGLQLQREFYVPRYDQANAARSRLPDARTLLYWNPALPTDANGNARASFPASDQTGLYLVEVNTLTTDGRTGSQQTRFNISDPPK